MKTLENIDVSKPVQVYRNLNKPGCLFSVRQGGLVRGYVESIVLMDCKFKHANPKQLAEVRSGARQVCQWISGTISEITLVRGDRPVLEVSCDPKTANGFCVDGVQIDKAAIVAVSKLGCFAVR
jgi:hypothetical protein